MKTRNHRLRATLLTAVVFPALLLVCAGAAAKGLRVGVVAPEDPYTTSEGLAKVVRRAGGRPQDVTRALARGRVPWGKLDALVVGSFATADEGVRGGLEREAPALSAWLAKGHTLVVLAQEGRDTARLGGWLPDGLEAAWGDRDGAGFRLLVPDHLLLAGLVADVVSGRIGDWQPTPGRSDKSPHLRGVHDAFRRLRGFRVVAALERDGGGPAIAVGAHGAGRVVLVALPVDEIAFEPRAESDGAGARRLFANLLSYADAVRRGQTPNEPAGEPPTDWDAASYERVVVVFDDRDGDGARDEGEPPLAGISIGHGLARHETGVDGTVSLTVDAAAPRWIHVQKPSDRRASGPLFVRDDGRDGARDDGRGEILFPLAPGRWDPKGDVSFVQVTDVHVGVPGISDELVAALFRGIGAAAPAVDFVLATGDLTQRGTSEEIERWVALQSASPVPVIPVRGNHDAGRGPDRGRFYDEQVGPLYYGFDHRGLHVTVGYVANADSPEWQWVREDIEAAAARGLPTLVALHHLPRTELLDSLRGLPLVAVLHGHWHGGRVVTWDSAPAGGPRAPVPVVGTSTALMGGWDDSPPSVRQLTFRAGRLQSTSLRYPGLDRHVTLAGIARLPDTGELHVVVHAHDPWRPPQSGTAQLVRAGRAPRGLPDGGDGDAVEVVEAPLAPTGPLTWTATFPGRAGLAEAGPAALHVTFADAVQTWPAVGWDVELPATRAPTTPEGVWPAFRGGSRRTGVARGGPRPPLQLAWVTSLPGAIHAGGPVVDRERVYVNLEDRETPSPRGPGPLGGVTALDRRTGRVVWSKGTDVSVRHAPVVSRGVVFFQSEDGAVFAVDAATGDTRWRFDLAQRFPPRYVGHWASCAPLATRTHVVACYHARPVVLDRRDGRLVATLDRQGREDAFTTSSAALAGDTLYHGGLHSGLTAYRFPKDGAAERRWRTRGLTMLATPVAAADGVLVQATKGIRLFAAADGATRKQIRLPGARAAASPILTDDRVFAFDRRGRLTAWDRARDRARWTVDTDPSPLPQAMYAVIGTPSVTGSPVLARGHVWFGAEDGKLRAVRASDGELAWSVDLGLPVTGGPAVAGDDLYVADMGGVVYAFRR